MSASATTRFGMLHGTALGEGSVSVHQYLGVPFAEPPRRFADPIDWSAPFEGGARLAMRPGSVCVQPTVTAGDGFQGSEDCLFLNVWAPAPSTVPLPVLFFVHGGDFLSGSGGEYNSSRLAARHRVVVVTTNYRLGALGWARLSEGRANWGLKDQRSALRWVRSNIAAFGGDPRRLCIFGESAGASSVALHLLSPASRGLFGAALMESGSPIATPAGAAEELAADFFRHSGCGEAQRRGGQAVLSCLRAAPLARLWRAASAATAPPPGGGFLDQRTFASVVDGVEVPARPFELVASGALARVALLGGTNTDEGSGFVLPAVKRPLSAAAYTDYISKLTLRLEVPRANLSDVLAVYPPRPAADNAKLAAALATDFLFRCGTRHLARAMSSRGNRAYLYRFDQRARDDTSEPVDWGVTHGSEVPFVFERGSWIDSGNTSFTPAERLLSVAIGGMWAAFASRAQPLPPAAWPAYRNGSEAQLVLSIREDATAPPPFRVEVPPRARECDFWERLQALVRDKEQRVAAS